VAKAALAGELNDPTRGALFFHADYVAPNRFFRTRKRLVTIEDHIFYR
jgi:N-acetylmuramoyl-L-alanine amidase